MGQIAVHFTDDTHATVTWPGGVVQIEREIFSAAEAPTFQPLSGWWWNPTEGGSGYSVEVQGTHLFVVGFMFDDTGRPVWYFSAGPMTDEQTYHGAVLQFANGQTMGGPYRPPGEPATIASLDIAFTAQNEATFTFTEATPSASLRKQVKANRTKKKSLQPQLPKPGTFVFPAAYDVYFQLYGKASISGVTSAIALASAGISVSKVGTGSEIQFYAQRIGTNPSFVLDYEYRAQGCTFVSTRTLDGVPFELTITSYARYTLHFLVPPGTVPGQLKCPDSNDPVVLPFPGFDVTFSGVVQGRDRDGARCAGCIYSNTTGQPAPGVTYDYYYNLTPKP